MYSNSKYGVTIRIDLPNGVYEFNEDSATGKTRLCKELKELQRLGESVIGYTYGDDRLGINLIEVFNKIRPKVLVLDRYNMYNGTFNNEIVKWSADTIILVDCKGDLQIDCKADWCTIEMTADKIEVVSDAADADADEFKSRLKTFDEFRSKIETCRNSPVTMFTCVKCLIEHDILDTPLIH